MKPAELRELSNEQLENKLNDLHTEMRDLRFKEAIGQLTQTARVGQIKRDIARIHTIRTEMANQSQN